MLLGDELLVHGLLVSILFQEEGAASRDHDFGAVMVWFDARGARSPAHIAALLLLLELLEDFDARLLDLPRLIGGNVRIELWRCGCR